MSKSQIISVQASAGSGKTYSLASRYLYLLLSSDENVGIKNIVAMTFTNKAAVEMKYRVIGYLKKAALCLSTGDFFDNLGFTKSKLAERSKAVLKNIFECYDNFNISTIDSFKNHILKSCAINIDISPNFVIEQDYSDNLLFSLEIFLRKTQVSKNLKNIVLQYLSQYLARSSNWFPKNDMYDEIKKVFEKSGNIGKNILYHRGVSFKDEILLKSEVIISKVKKLANLIPPNFQVKKQHLYLNAIEKVLNYGQRIFFSMDIPKVFSHKTIEYKKDAKINVEVDFIWEEINKEIESLCYFYMENYYNVYLDIYSEVLLEFDKLAKMEGIVFLNEINRKTVNFFEENNTVIPEVYYRLSEKYKHFLIDEFQDTSLVQWLGIKRFLEESISEGGTFFYVGDVKQAIYSFRGGNPEIFNMMSKEFSVSGIDRKYLKQNFRSGKVIVDFNNGIFSKENIERFLKEIYKDKYFECDFSNFFETYAFSKQDAAGEHDYGYVELYTIDKMCENVEGEIKQKFMKCIFQCLERFNAQSITVLCRTHCEILSVSSWLFENGIEVESPQTLNIKNNECIKQIVSLLMFIDSPIDVLSFSSFIVGDVFSRVLGIENYEFEKFIFDCNKRNKTETFYKIFRDKYKSLWDEYFESFFVQAGFVPIYELTLMILSKFKIIENFPESKTFVMCFLELVKDFEMQDSGIKNFLEYFNSLRDDDESLYIKSAFGNGIKIMTVHKAKGLQFPVVIIPFLSLSDRSLERPYFFESREKIKLLNVSENVAKFSKEARKIYEKWRVNSLLSELNVLYVSMTRAEYEFYAIVPFKFRNSNNMVPILLGDRDIIIMGDKRKYDLEVIEESRIILDVFTGGYKDMQEYLKNANKKRLDVEDIKKKGSIIHYALSKITSLKNKNINDSVNCAFKFTRKKFPFDDIEFVREKLYSLFTSEEILSLFMYDNNIVYNEKEVVNTKGEVFRIDKLVVDDSEVIIADFKTSNYDEKGNEEQVRGYVGLISEIYPPKKISAYIVDVEKIVAVKCA
ncbi:MAG: UvrD-helicase domain-containing protein [Endomicrobium sp.]|jgi:ATP-dependent exoDNAse (exonuclease V) beta subunit|nr:UvrD-helicase domain-containing protein [Endomicrobium sp.]